MTIVGPIIAVVSVIAQLVLDDVCKTIGVGFQCVRESSQLVPSILLRFLLSRLQRLF